ncbi:MAG: hypothetical protein HYS64_03850 [Rhodospirillales bacterium]|nr:hypothetical protein [Rhodospirillales bacterium]
MKMKRNLSHLSTLTAVGLILAAGPSLAQTADVTEGGGSAGTTEASAPAESGGNTTNEGAFQALSPGGQKIARALFDAQKQPATDGAGGTGSTTGGTSATTGADGAGTTEAAASLSLDDIAAAKASGTGWGRVFKEMKAEGLIAEKNLGQVISGANHRNRLDAGDGTGTDTGADTGSGTTGTAAAATSATTTARPVSPSGHRTKPVTVTLANGATVVVGGQGRGHAPRGDADADATGSKSGTNRSHGGGFGTAGGHGHKQGLAADAAGRDFGALLGNGVSAGNSGHGSINSGPGSVNSGPGSINSGHGSVTAGSGVSHGGGHGSGKGSGR